MQCNSANNSVRRAVYLRQLGFFLILVYVPAVIVVLRWEELKHLTGCSDAISLQSGQFYRSSVLINITIHLCFTPSTPRSPFHKTFPLQTAAIRRTALAHFPVVFRIPRVYRFCCFVSDQSVRLVPLLSARQTDFASIITFTRAVWRSRRQHIA